MSGRISDLWNSMIWGIKTKPSFDDWQLETIEKQRALQMKLTVTVKNRNGDLFPQIIMIDGATPVYQIGQAIIEAVRVQTVNDGTGIVKATIGPDEIYNAG